MTSQGGLALTAVEVSYDSVRAVREVDLRVGAGETVVLLGPSGCGKSTLLRAVAGLEPLTAGRIAYDDQDLAGVPVHRRGFGLVFQDGQLFGHRDVAGNVDFGLRMAGVPRAGRATRVAELLELVGLPGYASRPVATLSGGEQQRVALARSLAPGPRLLLLDEPLSALDRALRERLTGDLAAILRETATTALHVTHDHDEAFALADRVAVMHQGRLRQVGTPQQVWSRPHDRVVAGFLGYTGFAPAGSLRAAGADLAALETGAGLEADTVVALRPDSLLVDPRGSVTATVREVAFSRGGCTLRVDAGPLGLLPARLAGPDAPAIGAVVRLRLEPPATGVLEVSDLSG